MSIPELRDADGYLQVREGVTIALFAQVPAPALAAGVAAILDRWLAVVPAEALAWAEVGADADRPLPVSPRTLPRIRGLLGPARVGRTDMTYFLIQGPEGAAVASYRLEVALGLAMPDPDLPDLTCAIDIRLPADVLDVPGVEAVVALVGELAAALPFDSGYASLGLHYGSALALGEFGDEITALALRHPGYDVAWNERSRYHLGPLSRGPRWLTLLGPALLGVLGGAESLAAALPDGVTAAAAGAGLLLRAGARPERGDVNGRDRLPALRELAALLEPVTLLDDPAVADYVFGGDADRAERWQRRLLT